MIWVPSGTAARWPVERSSRTTGACPAASRWRSVCEPMYPQPPVTRIEAITADGRGARLGGGAGVVLVVRHALRPELGEPRRAPAEGVDRVAVLGGGRLPVPGRDPQGRGRRVRAGDDPELVPRRVDPRHDAPLGQGVDGAL